MNRFLIILLLGLLLLRCGKKEEDTVCNNIPLEKSSVTDKVEYEIINSIFEKYYPNYSLIVINQQTVVTGDVSIECIKERFSYEAIQYDSLSLSDYAVKNDTCYFLSDSLVKPGVQLISYNEILCLFNNFGDNGWAKYYQKYPKYHGFFSFSRPGINPQGNRAVIEYDTVHGPDAGTWYLLLLEKIDDKWIITHRFITAVA